MLRPSCAEGSKFAMAMTSPAASIVNPYNGISRRIISDRQSGASQNGTLLHPSGDLQGLATHGTLCHHFSAAPATPVSISEAPGTGNALLPTSNLPFATINYPPKTTSPSDGDTDGGNNIEKNETVIDKPFSSLAQPVNKSSSFKCHGFI